ncbi:dihydrofolate reductase family protein [Microbacterium binotii]|uniref:Dihydrofolate reductase family protein n=1 Tax=Microbacterium binotii TaxID=462710 RepID=A0ABP6BT92_9MICO
MGLLRYSINVTLDGRVDHRSAIPDEELHRRAAEYIARADVLLFGRVTYEMMQDAWRPPASDALPDWMQPFGRTIDAARKYVVSRTLPDVDWNAELVRGDLATAVRALKRDADIATGGVMLPTALAELGLIDEYEFVVHPRVTGHGPRLFDGLSEPLDLELTERIEYGSGAVASRYVPRATAR